MSKVLTTQLPYLRKLHFLPVKLRIDFKIPQLVNKCVNRLALISCKITKKVICCVTLRTSVDTLPWQSKVSLSPETFNRFFLNCLAKKSDKKIADMTAGQITRSLERELNQGFGIGHVVSCASSLAASL